MRLLLILILFLASCSPLRHYKYVAGDDDVTPKKKAIIAPKVAVLFPPKTDTSFIKGDVIRDTLPAEIDTVYHENYKEIHHYKPIVERRVDTVRVETINTAALFAVQDELNKLSARYARMEEDLAASTRTQRKLLYALGASVLLNILFIAILIRRR